MVDGNHVVVSRRRGAVAPVARTGCGCTPRGPSSAVTPVSRCDWLLKALRHTHLSPTCRAYSNTQSCASSFDPGYYDDVPISQYPTAHTRANSSSGNRPSRRRGPLDGTPAIYPLHAFARAAASKPGNDDVVSPKVAQDDDLHTRASRAPRTGPEKSMTTVCFPLKTTALGFMYRDIAICA
eukprot:COSAG01_NODE_499_length_16240_cov_43.337092_1_plen_181_part_00